MADGESSVLTLLITVVIPAFNRADALPATLKALGEQTVPPDRYEVILVDDGSTDTTGEVLGDTKPSYRFEIVPQRNRGGAAARNLGASKAASTLILFLDCDMVVVPDFLERHIATARQCGPALVIGPRAPYASAERDRVASLLMWGVDQRDPRWRRLPPTFQEAFGCNLALPAESFQSLGGFDETFPGSCYEDIDLAYRATKLGLPIVFDAGALAYHNHPLTLGQYLEHVRKFQRSAILFLRKHPELVGSIQHLADKWPISWRCDPPRLVARKLARAGLALRPSRWLLERLVRALMRAHASSSVVLTVADKLVGSYLYLGLRDGIRRYGSPPLP
ncbi:MAG TPA: glycosyltransferase family 2 protein [Anaerolineae bacterium]|nr:glycosyltransferase family 2 protein [Anaerolineae bacterium]